MNIDNISSEEMEKLGTIFGQGYAQLRADFTRVTAENQAVSNTVTIVTKDRDYWRERASNAEIDRDAAQDLCEFLIRQWEGVISHSEETRSRWTQWRTKLVKPDQLPPPDKPPSVVVFNRGA
jgi:hypothetical protein